ASFVSGVVFCTGAGAGVSTPDAGSDCDGCCAKPLAGIASSRAIDTLQNRFEFIDWTSDFQAIGCGAQPPRSFYFSSSWSRRELQGSALSPTTIETQEGIGRSGKTKVKASALPA